MASYCITRGLENLTICCRNLLLGTSTISPIFCSSRLNALSNASSKCIQPVRFSSRKAKRERRMQKRRDRLLAKQANPWVPRKLILQKQQDTALAREHLRKKWVTRYPLIPERPREDVYLAGLYAPQSHPVEEAVASMRQLADPSMYDCLHSYLYLVLDLNMKLEKKNKYLSSRKGFYRVPHFFDEGESRRIIALTKDDSIHQATIDAGAALVGGLDLIEEIRTGGLGKDDFDCLVATPDILQELGEIKKALKERMPTVRSGTVTFDLPKAVDTFYNQKTYHIYRPLDTEHHWGQCKVPIGTLDMETSLIRENLEALVSSVRTQRPARLGKFITAAILRVEETKDELYIDVEDIIARATAAAAKDKVRDANDEESSGDVKSASI